VLHIDVAACAPLQYTIDQLQTKLATLLKRAKVEKIRQTWIVQECMQVAYGLFKRMCLICPQIGTGKAYVYPR
jgi:hypothetical protein